MDVRWEPLRPLCEKLRVCPARGRERVTKAGIPLVMKKCAGHNGRLFDMICFQLEDMSRVVVALKGYKISREVVNRKFG